MSVIDQIKERTEKILDIENTWGPAVELAVEECFGEGATVQQGYNHEYVDLPFGGMREGEVIGVSYKIDLPRESHGKRRFLKTLVFSGDLQVSIYFEPKAKSQEIPRVLYSRSRLEQARTLAASLDNLIEGDIRIWP